MKKIAVFGKPGNGKSSLGKDLESVTGIKLYHLDSIAFKKNGDLVNRKKFDIDHENILSSDSWIIEGFGPIVSFNQRLDSADTWVYIDLPYLVSYWFVTKRLIKGLFVKPYGWPEGSSIIKGTFQSYKMLRLSRSFWNDDFLENLEGRSAHNKHLHVIRSVSELNRFITLI